MYKQLCISKQNAIKKNVHKKTLSSFIDPYPMVWQALTQTAEL